MYGDLGKVDAAADVQSTDAGVTTELHIDETSTDYTGSLGW